MLPGRGDYDPAVRVVLQRVRWAAVDVGGERIAAIGPGLLALVGIADGDGADDALRLARKTARLRVLAGPERPFDLSLRDVPGAELLCVSQFTLLADLRRGNRPSWAARRAPRGRRAARGGLRRGALRPRASRWRAGASRPRWRSALENDGPVTIVLDSAELAGSRASGGTTGTLGG